MILEQTFIFLVGFSWGLLALHVFQRARRRTLAPGTCDCGHARHTHRLGLYGCAELTDWKPVPGAVRTCPCMHYMPDSAHAQADTDLEQLRRMARLEDRR